MSYNYLVDLLTMSFRYKCYKEVSRNYIDTRMLNKINEECEFDSCSNCLQMRHVRSELMLKGYYTSMKHIQWWRISHHWGAIIIEPVTDND